MVAVLFNRLTATIAPLLLLPPPLFRHGSPSMQIPNFSGGHTFVVHGDVLSLSADALLVPTRNLNNKKWFPSGPPDGALQPPREDFTADRRVIRVEGTSSTAPPVWLSLLDGRFAPEERKIDGDAPELAWFLEAAEQFLAEAHADLRERELPPRCGRAKHVLALPIVGTGKGGARDASGEIIAALLQAVDEYARANDIDVALVVKNDRMFSAAQAKRRQLSQRWEEKLGTRLAAAAEELADLAASERLCIFLGAGVSVGAGLPEWKELLAALASRQEVPLDDDEIRQLATLGLPDQAAVVASKISSGLSSGDGPLASLVVDELSSPWYSITHGLLAGLPISACVTTNYDNLFETAWRAADKQFNVLPYETQPSDRFILKLHGDLQRPQDIVLTRSQMFDSREQRKALSGIVQTMLLTKHLLFLGFSLQDPNFSEVAGEVRRARRESSSDGGSGDSEPFGTLLCLHNRPFLAELWPELNTLPMDLTDEQNAEQRVPNTECARLVEILLDKVSLDSSTTTRHLLDGAFSGVFSPQEDALKEHLQAFRERVSKNELARQSSGFSVVRQTLRRLGDLEGEPADPEAPDL